MPKRSKNGSRFRKLFFCILLIAIGYASWCLLRPMPSVQPSYIYQDNKVATASVFNWPKKGQASVGILGYDQVESNGVQNKAPIASVAKVITALVVLEKKPLAIGSQGPTITLGPQDEIMFRQYQANDGSVVPAANGEKITQYQMLQAMMLPSANNMSDGLAIWAFGSIDAYTQAANQYLKAKGLTETTVSGDASGLNPATVSTSKDLIKLGKLAMNNPVLAGIVNQQTATGIPLTSSVKNVNFLLGNSNIVGIKTGNSDQAGGVFLSASVVTPNDKPVTIITSVEQADNLYSALSTSLVLIKSVQSSFKQINIVKDNQVVAIYKLPWGDEIKARSMGNINVASLPKMSPVYNVQVESLRPNAKAGDIIGKVKLSSSALNQSKSVSVKLDSSASKPTIKWRLTHPI